ncbi:MAG: DNA polymerase I [Phycisphaerales bacterium]|nr:DNA polymerase I [Phycisphaerales bacterium]
MAEKKLFLLDAMALIYRAYFALARSPRVTSNGKNTNAQFGFTNTLVELLTKEKPTHLAVVFDTKAATVRHDDFSDYKANREAAPDDLILSIPDIKRIIKGFNLPCMELDGYEADDLIGTLAWEAADLGYTVYMVTPDKDYGQLVRNNVFMYKPAAFGLGPQVLGPQQICEKWDIKRVDQVIDLLGLMGDASDNIPGIKGVGEKTAAKLLAEYDTLENVLEHAHEIKGALGEKVRAGKESAIMSKRLATIITNVPVAFHEGDFKVEEWNKEALSEVFAELEFKTMATRLLGASAASATPSNAAPAGTDLFGNAVKTKPAPSPKAMPASESSNVQQMLFDLLPQSINNIGNTPHDYILLSAENLDAFIKDLSVQKSICFDSESTHIDANLAELVGMSFAWEKGKAFYLSLPEERKTVLAILEQFRPIFEDENREWIGQNIKYDMLLLKWYGFELKGSIYDTMLAHYVIEPEGKHNMDVLSSKYLNYEPVSIETLIGKKGKEQGNMRDADVEAVKEYAAEDADVTLQLKSSFDPLLQEKEVATVFRSIENPLVPVLTDVEYEGIRIDEGFLKSYSQELQKDIATAEESVYAQAEVRFNLASPKQLGEILFDHMKLDPKAKKTKTGQYATGEDILEKLRSKHKIVDDILVFRELSKLKSTYVDSLPLLVNPKTRRVHTSFNQAVAVTGRLSSNNPNLQNIPIRTDRGREIRKAFIPRDEHHVLISADYSQIELRIVAAISGDERMIQAFKDDKDIHTATAATVYGISESEVDKTQRRNAKAVNFGIIYGQSAFGLAENLGISRTEAKSIIDSYFERFEGIKKYMSATIAFAQDHGYVQTIAGRKRWLPDIHSGNQVVRGYAERNAINMPIQGTAADMIKLAMIAVHKAIKKEGLQTKMILQVHDELVFDVPRNEIDIVRPIIIREMENAMVLPNGVPIKAESGVGDNWLEAH